MWLRRSTLIPLALLIVLLSTGVDAFISIYAAANVAVIWKLGVDPETPNTPILNLRPVHLRGAAQTVEDSYASLRPRYIIIDDAFRSSFDWFMLFGVLLAFLWSVVMLFNRCGLCNNVYVSKLATAGLAMYVAYVAFWVYTHEAPLGTASVDLTKFRVFTAATLGYLTVLCLMALFCM